MTPAEVGRAWFAEGGPLLRGMLVRGPDGSFADDDDSDASTDGLVLDVEDAASVGAMLSAVREKYGDPHLFVRWSTSRGCWLCCRWDTVTVVRGESEAEALLAAWRAGG